MEWQQTIAGLLLALGSWVSLLNWVVLLVSWRTGKFHSAIPFVGGFCLGVGALLLPPLRPYAWAAVLLDWGTIVVVLSLPSVVQELWETSWFNLVEECVGVRGRTTVRLRLFRRGVVVINWDIARPKGEHGLVGMGQLGRWEQGEDRLTLRLGDDEAVLVPLDGPPGWRPSVWFGFCRNSEDLYGDGLELRRRYPTAT
ncbi:hypothetical protein [Urbifossiella limnaea]|uniref:Uncharacterized protein n=1 Tax=Urbifossiella limnaea TaxID=2528023 RepID=A0A517XSV6_9BACT|nr:hypothetical protein [Urbifossiella limnaea]QDU20571.1 hypothetical protein ETAA1_25260 [Urbifossiella limnaea]